MWTEKVQDVEAVRGLIDSLLNSFNNSPVCAAFHSKRNRKSFKKRGTDAERLFFSTRFHENKQKVKAKKKKKNQHLASCSSSDHRLFVSLQLINWTCSRHVGVGRVDVLRLTNHFQMGVPHHPERVGGRGGESSGGQKALCSADGNISCLDLGGLMCVCVVDA